MPSLLFLVWTIATAILTAVPANNIRWDLDRNARKDSEFEILKKLEIEKMKSKLLQAFGMDEAPTFSNSLLPLSKDTIQALIENNEPKPPVQEQNNLANLMIFPSNRDFQCQWYNSSSCRRFEYRISPDVVPASKEFWVHKLTSHASENLTIFVFCELPKQKANKIFEHEEILNDSDTSKWLFVQIPPIKTSKFWQDSVVYSVEITGIVIDERENTLPFLKIVKDMEARIRKKKTEGSTTNTTNNTCISVPFNVSFAEMDFTQWILYPESYKANICQGYCLKAQSYHETLIGIIFERNKTLEEIYGSCWGTCCRPKEYETLSIIYRETDHTIVHRNMTNMIVKSCSCS